MNKYLIITEDDNHYSLSAEKWQEALVKYYAFCGEWSKVSARDYEKLIEDKTASNSVDLFNFLQNSDSIEFFGRIGGIFIDNAIFDIDKELKGE